MAPSNIVSNAPLPLLRTPSPPTDREAVAPSADEVPLATVLDGRYVVGPVLAAGGMGVIHSGRHVELGQDVAIKFLRPEIFDRPSIAQRFLNEARAAASLRSENVIRVFDVGELDSGIPYLVMERLEGTDLDRILEAEGPLEVARALDYALQVCAALSEAHQRGVVHRDIKPENLFITRGADGREIVKVVDFGLAKRVDEAKNLGLTGPNDSMGSPYYMSPEQVAQPQLVDERTDLWSLGVVLYRLLTNRVPFEGDTVMEVYARILNAPVRSMRDYRPSLGRDLDAIVARCLEKDPERRFRSAGALADAIREHQEGFHRLHETPGSMAPPVFVDDTPIQIPGVRSRWPSLAALAVLLLGGALLYEADRTGHLDLRSTGEAAWERVTQSSAFRGTEALATDASNAVVRAVNHARGVPELGPTVVPAVPPPTRSWMVPAAGVVTDSPAFDSSGVTLGAERERERPEDSVSVIDSLVDPPFAVPPGVPPHGDSPAQGEE
ncbi:MAG TPA: serine/threonine-protein kinase [Polyangiaceae bacterium]|nr:serine/threonine-protein kinase [Polyangiaceae bacterium]